MGTPSTRDSGKPVYLQIADDLAEQIRTGTLSAGDKLPSESELMKRYGVVAGTTRRAVAELRSLDLAETHHGKGTFVKRRPTHQRKAADRFRRSHRKAGKAAFLAESEQMGSSSSVEVLHVGRMPAPDSVAELLDLSPASAVLVRRRLYFRDGTPTEEATSYLPWDVVSDIPEMHQDNPGGGGIYARLEDHGHTLGSFHETVRARLASKEERGRLKLSPGAPILHLTRVAKTEEGQAVEVCDTVMAADLWSLDYIVPAED
ncbi:GntR family transcriptional regulator [Streptomyces spiramenti]|uniref:GntR family transcriptional regulator n=1 Tax=Streptomyces spiramenti TaxID=2720606 RepID=A0ABX1AC66_9ACTN|nr:GntR family transcriptional regulator [Streptomyces spiramenti]NJP64792.1 GntR family transcriptional regulator [Streptomyces spiramenti]